MSQFIHAALGHFLSQAMEEDGSDLSGADDQQQEQQDDDQGGNAEDGQQEEEGDVVVTIAGEASEEEEETSAAAPNWVKELRKTNREDKKRIRELEEQLRKQEPQKQTPVLGKKPSMSDDDIDYDEEKFEARLSEWHDRKRQIEQAEQDQRQQQEQQQAEWTSKLESYAQAKTKLKVPDFEDAEAVVLDMFDQTQQGIIIDAMDNPAQVIYALGKNPGVAKAMAAIKTPTKFLREMSRLEDTKLKVQPKKSAPAPEKTVTGGQARISGGSDATLERLRDEAEKTGDYSKVTAYRRQLRDKQKA